MSGLDGAKHAYFKKLFEDLAVTFVKTDKAFAEVISYAEDYAKRTGQVVPLKICVELRDMWRDIVLQSKDFSFKRSTDYDDYVVFLKTIHDLTTDPEGMKRAVVNLDNFRRNKPTEIPSDITDRFLTLKNDVAHFRANFQAEFQPVIPALDVIIASLAQIARLWQEFRVRSLEFTLQLDKLRDTKLLKIFKMRILLALEQVVPLAEGLKKYATNVVI